MAHYYSEKQDSYLDLKKIKIRLKDSEFEIYTASGIFSKEGLDNGTSLLIEKAEVGDNWEVLDLGCGYGAVGIALKKKYPSTKIIMSDTNDRAVMISNKNIRLHGLKDIEARKSDVFSNIPELFDTILLNPPQTAGREICYRMIVESISHLKEGGLFQMVARHNKGGETLSKKMDEIYGNVRSNAIKGGFRVYISKKD